MKKPFLITLAIFFICGFARTTPAIDFKIQGQWLVTFGGGQAALTSSTRKGNVRSTPTEEHFTAAQRLRLQLEASASENLSGTVQIQVGMQKWGNNAQGGALGADGISVKVRQAYIDWMFPEVDIKTRMGLQFMMLPNKMGPIVMMARVAGIVSSWSANDNIDLTGFWIRPDNDNYTGIFKNENEPNYHANYLDNMDLFGLILSLKYDGFNATPWAMYGMMGKNTNWTGQNGNPNNANNLTSFSTAGLLDYTLYPYPGIMNRGPDKFSNSATGKAYGSMFWAGLPIGISAFDPWNIELDFNYGYVEAMGRYNAYKGAVTPENLKRSSTQRQGWIARGLIEYKTDWGIPGIYGWYASGDDGNPKNGSERMPSLAGYQTLTTFLGTSNYQLIPWHERSLDMAGTWGVGVRLRDMSFIENLQHSFMATWWGGTNSPSMIKYMNSAYAWTEGWGNFDGPYMTTKDGLLELNLVNKYQMYENFNIYGELGYVANFMDNDAWSKAGAKDSSFRKQDAWKAVLSFEYQF